MTGGPSLAVIIPFFDEERNVEAVCSELRFVLEAKIPHSEIILVDDGSVDRTGPLLDEMGANWPACRVFHLPENRGQSAALLFGFAKSTAMVLATMDGDGQNDPRDIPRLLARLPETDMVVGARVARHDGWARRAISRIANVVRSRLLGDRLSDAGCALKVFRRQVIEAFIPIRTLYSFMPALAVAAGFRVLEVPVNHRSRSGGDSHYTVGSFLFFPIVDLIGLEWFGARRCPPPARERPPRATARRDLGEDLYRHRRWAMRALFTVTGTGAILFFLLLPRHDSDGPLRRKINLTQAERIALRQVPKGSFGTEELQLHHGRLRWVIDIQRQDSEELREVQIDALDGRLIAVESESAAEEELEQAVQDHSFSSKERRPP